MSSRSPTPRAKTTDPPITACSDLQHYVDHTQRDDGNLHDWEMTLLSPTKFTNFVAHRCGGTWVEG